MAGGTSWTSILLLLCLVVFAGAQDDIREPPKITTPVVPDELFFERGEDVTLQCSASGEPKPMYQWYWNGAPIETNQVTSYDSSTGVLTIKGLTVREEGFYNCRAKNTFPNGMSAVAISPKIEVRVARIGPWQKSEDRTKNAMEGNYVFITCEENLPEYYGPTNFKWYTIEGEDDLREVVQDERVFIDAKGTLHFTYVLRSDEQSSRYYACAMSNAVEGQIKLGGKTKLVVAPSSSIAESPPALQFSTKSSGREALTFERNTQGRLECFFSGYINEEGKKVPTITWQDNAGQPITTQGRYRIENEGRVLLINNLVEADEKPYTCIGTNKLNTAEGTMTLNVTSSPIWIQPLQATTVPQGQNAVFHCEARSAASENPPNPPRWMKNGQRLDQVYDPNKYSFTDGKRVMTVKSAQKNTDIACFQCFVSNSVGEVFSDGCLNVILPIEIVTQPAEEQSVRQGDIVNLTVVATSDNLYPVTYKWYFKNETYEANQAPPHVIYDFETKLAYINTTDLTDEEMREIRGVYRRQVYHKFQSKDVYVEVTLKDEPVVVAVAEGGFDFWIIGLILGILIIIIIILIICCVICRRKMLEGDYPVDRKETAAGLDPEKELKDSGFLDLSRADYDYYPEKKSPALDFDDIPIGEGDDESFGSAEYGEEATAFNEDGSFIGVYSKDNKSPNAPPAYQPATESNV